MWSSRVILAPAGSSRDEWARIVAVRMGCVFGILVFSFGFTLARGLIGLGAQVKAKSAPASEGAVLRQAGTVCCPCIGLWRYRLARYLDYGIAVGDLGRVG
jgi:hypothetical protein